MTRRPLICIDPGHGNYDSGAVGPSGTKEKDITLAVGLKTGALLQAAGMSVVYTRTSDQVPWPADVNKDLAKRCQIANDAGADVFVSIHCNSAVNVTAKGNETYTFPGQGNADALANCIHARIKAAFPELTYREDWSDGDPDKEASFYVLKYTKMPAVLSELAFISNPVEEKMLASEEFQDKAALAIARGIGDYLGVAIPEPVKQSGVSAAVDTLVASGVIGSPDYWLNNAQPGKTVSGENVAALIQKMAAKIQEMEE